MSKAIVKKFFDELDRKPEMSKEFLSKLDEKADREAIVYFAESNGFKFSQDELVKYCIEHSEDNGELDDADLAKAAGGRLALHSGEWLRDLFQRIINGKKIF